MSDSQQIEKDLREYLEAEGNLRREDRLRYLKAIFDKHFTLSKLDHMITRNDFLGIVSSSKSAYNHLNLPINVSNKKIDNSELTTLAMIEGFTAYLNKNHLLKKLVRLDYTDSNDFEEID